MVDPLALREAGWEVGGGGREIWGLADSKPLTVSPVLSWRKLNKRPHVLSNR